MSAPDLTAINNYFAQRPSIFHKNMYARFWRSNPFASLFPRAEFDMSEGRIPTIITATHELPTGYPTTALSPGIGDGTGDKGCDVPAVTVGHGHKTRSFQLEQYAFQTPVFCLSDLQYMQDVLTQVKNMEKGLAEYVQVFLSDWSRTKNISMIDHKATTTGATSLAEKSDTLGDFSTLALPTHELEWEHLDAIYDTLISRGGGEYAPGQAMGQPVFSLITGPAYKRKLFQTNDKVRETVNWSGNSKENFTARGINTSVNGFAPNVDELPMRIAADATTKIYPTKNQATTSGQESVANPDYRSVAKGGLAVYEVVEVLCSNIYEVDVRPVGPTSFGKQRFTPANYTGSVQWINNPDMANNPLGNHGYYRVDIQQAAKPQYPELGYSILTLVKD